MAISSVRIIATTLEGLRALDKYELDLKHRAARQLADECFMVPGILTDEQIQEVEAAGYTVEILADMAQVAAERIMEVSPFNRFAEARGLTEFDERAIMGYMTADEVEAALINLQKQHPDLVTLIQLPNRSWENRISRAVRVRAGTKANRVGILFTGSMHAREWGGSDICITFLVNLINAYRAGKALVYGAKNFSATKVKTILENVDLFVFPDVNPDGKNYSQTHDPSSGSGQNFWWRKNRNPNTAVDPAHPGVDLNRNFDFLWSSDIGTSSTPSSLTYKGVCAFSEPETQNIRWLLDSYPGIGFYLDIHSYSGLILYSWGDDNNQTADPNQNFLNPVYNGKRGNPGDTQYREFIATLDENTAAGYARRMSDALTAVRGQSYTVQQAVGLYPTSATSDDYTFSRHIVNGLKRKVYSFTIEFGQDFVPPFSEMSNIIKDVSSAMTELCWAINSDVYVRDNPADTGAVPSSGSFWNSPDIWVRNAADGGTTHQNTIRGQDNFIYVRVSNRGLAEAREVKVRVCITNFAGTEFSYPNDWIPKNPSGGGTLTTTGTYLVGQVQIPVLAAGASQIVTTKWIASLIPKALNWHPCLLVEVSPNDGPLIPGKNVWQNNNLAQKNITIVNAHKGEFLEFPFVVGSKFDVIKGGEIVVKRVLASSGVGVFLDVQDLVLIESIKPALVTMPGDEGVLQSDDELPSAGTVATLLQPAIIALSNPVSGQERNDESLILHLPANTRLEVLNSRVDRDLATTERRLTSGFELVTIDDKPLLSLLSMKEGRIPLLHKTGETKKMVLRVSIPKTAATGDHYEFQVVQNDDSGRAVGGVILEIHVVA